jgi:hypothetical protein
MFDSPLEWCSHCRDWVALDQTFEEHVRECACPCRRDACPLAALFRPAERTPARERYPLVVAR